ncbi:RadC family protein [Staphylococcus epidermidis]|uniref:RadC family protein n=5 Tax=Staphylococcus TaxID=1279 RepID=UPI00138AD4B9|nr:DNA repair protein RadC [Staphylococcus epidermidis]
MRINEMALHEKPRERLITYGAKSLSNVELLAILLNTGRKGFSSIDIANELLKQQSTIRDLKKLSINDLLKIKGIGLYKAVILQAAFELGERINSTSTFDKVQITHPSDVASLMMSTMKDLEQEHFVVLLLNSKNIVTKQAWVYKGTLNSSIIHPREVFNIAIRESSNSIIVVHNHPSGDVSLRLEDIVTWDNQIHLTPRDVNVNEAYIKLRKERTIHVSKELMSLYTDYLIYEYSEELEHDYVFISLKEGYFGKPLKYQSVLDLVRRIVKRTGIEFTSHMLRHTHATQLIREGWDVAFVQKRLGHAHVQTTLNTYVHLSDQDMKNEFNKYLERKEHKK